MLKRNVLANYLGQGWVALMGLLFVPAYVRYLGLEAYGLVGLFALMQAWLALLDLGISPTLTREMARFSAGAHDAKSIRDLLFTLETVTWTGALVIAASIWGGADFLASHWLQAEKIPQSAVAEALSVMAFVCASRFCEGIYRGSLYGLQRQVYYNIASAVLATVRHGGALALLAFVSPTIHAFFLWQAANSVLSLAILAVGVHRLLPRSSSRARFSLPALSRVWKFASGMVGLSLLSLLITQVDKLLLSRLLRLEDFGAYTLASVVAGGIGTLIQPITEAVYPHLVELATADRESELKAKYHLACQLVVAVAAPAVVVLLLFPSGLVYAWSGDSALAAKTEPVLRLLGLGTFLHALLHVPYYLQLAYGWTRLNIIANMLAVVILVPALFVVVPRFGAAGAAWVWVILNATYVLLYLRFMHRRILTGEMWHWYFNDLALPLLGAGCAGAAAWLVAPASNSGRVVWGLFLMGTGLVALLGTCSFAGEIRGHGKHVWLRCAEWVSSPRGKESG